MDDVETKLMKLLKLGNVMLEGPPGTGKTTLVYRVVEKIRERDFELKLVVATPDASWTTREFVGGSYLINQSEVWRSGYLLRAVLSSYYQPTLLLVDEINRCDADKTLGLFFTVFRSPYHEYWDFKALYTFLREQEEVYGKLDEVGEELLDLLKKDTDTPKRRLRIVSTFNTVDYATTYQLGEALRRRFFHLIVKNDIEDIEEVINKAEWDNLVYKNFLIEFLKKVHERSSSHSPLPVYKSHVETFMKLYFDVGFSFSEAFQSVFVPPSIELEYATCEEIREILEELIQIYKDKYGDDVSKEVQKMEESLPKCMG